ncbi:MAG: hypothetical protein ACRCR6_11650 [Plesiomonas sp.]
MAMVYLAINVVLALVSVYAIGDLLGGWSVSYVAAIALIVFLPRWFALPAMVGAILCWQWSLLLALAVLGWPLVLSLCGQGLEKLPELNRAWHRVPSL